MYNKRATETRHCFLMLGYSMVQYTCTTRGPQRLDTASTCWATEWNSFVYLVVTGNTQTHKLLEILLHYSVR